MAKTSSPPFVSVIVPVLNSPDNIERCISALLSQSYSTSNYEVIIIDNGSNDHTVDLIKKYPVLLLVADEHKSPYLARNVGIHSASGRIIAFTDSDCVPSPTWIENGVKSLIEESASLLGGHVSFLFSEEKTVAEIVDSITNLEVKNNVKLNGVAKTGNLFVQAEVFNSIGLFPTNLRSGGDILWTRKATEAGFRIIYSREVEVFKPARKLGALLQKQLRVGRGKSFVHIEQGHSYFSLVHEILTKFRPCRPSRIRSMIRERGTSDMEKRLIEIWVVTYLCIFATNLGRINYLLGQWQNEQS